MISFRISPSEMALLDEAVQSRLTPHKRLSDLGRAAIRQYIRTTLEPGLAAAHKGDMWVSEQESRHLGIIRRLADGQKSLKILAEVVQLLIESRATTAIEAAKREIRQAWERAGLLEEPYREARLRAIEDMYGPIPKFGTVGWDSWTLKGRVR